MLLIILTGGRFVVCSDYSVGFPCTIVIFLWDGATPFEIHTPPVDNLLDVYAVGVEFLNGSACWAILF